MTKMIYLLFTSIALFSCAENGNENCVVQEIKTMNISIGIKTDSEVSDTSYYHDVFVRGISLSCIDSMLIQKFVQGYLDSCSMSGHIGGITIFNDDNGYKYFWHETQDWPLMKKAFVLSLGINEANEITEYDFRNDNGELMYFGKSFSDGLRAIR